MLSNAWRIVLLSAILVLTSGPIYASGGRQRVVYWCPYHGWTARPHAHQQSATTYRPTPTYTVPAAPASTYRPIYGPAYGPPGSSGAGYPLGAWPY